MIDPGPEPVVRRELPVILRAARIPIPNDVAVANGHFADQPLTGGDAAAGCVAVPELAAQDVPHRDVGSGANA